MAVHNACCWYKLRHQNIETHPGGYANLERWEGCTDNWSDNSWQHWGILYVVGHLHTKTGPLLTFYWPHRQRRPPIIARYAKVDSGSRKPRNYKSGNEDNHNSPGREWIPRPRGRDAASSTTPDDNLTLSSPSFPPKAARACLSCGISTKTPPQRPPTKTPTNMGGSYFSS